MGLTDAQHVPRHPRRSPSNMCAAQEVLLGILVAASALPVAVESRKTLAAVANPTGHGASVPVADLMSAPSALKTCYWFEGYDARGVNNTSWDGPVRTNLRAGCIIAYAPNPPPLATGCDLRDQCRLGAGGEQLHERPEVVQALHEGGLLHQVPGARLHGSYHGSSYTETPILHLTHNHTHTVHAG